VSNEKKNVVVKVGPEKYVREDLSLGRLCGAWVFDGGTAICRSVLSWARTFYPEAHLVEFQSEGGRPVRVFGGAA